MVLSNQEKRAIQAIYGPDFEEIDIPTYWRNRWDDTVEKIREAIMKAMVSAWGSY
jgi:hypothetical protein